MVWHRGVCRIFGFRIERYGTVSRNVPTLFVCNHTSYLDISALGAVVPGSFVAKAEVRGWPLFGFLAKSCSGPCSWSAACRAPPITATT